MLILTDFFYCTLIAITQTWIAINSIQIAITDI